MFYQFLSFTKPPLLQRNIPLEWGRFGEWFCQFSQLCPCTSPAPLYGGKGCDGNTSTPFTYNCLKTCASKDVDWDCENTDTQVCRKRNQMSGEIQSHTAYKVDKYHHDVHKVRLDNTSAINTLPRNGLSRSLLDTTSKSTLRASAWELRDQGVLRRVGCLTSGS